MQRRDRALRVGAAALVATGLVTLALMGSRADGRAGGTGETGGVDGRPTNERCLCEQTGGTWDPLSCGHYVCGIRPLCEAIIPGCDCGEGRVFVAGKGCVTSEVCTNFCPADFNGDLFVGFGDLSSMLSEWGFCDDCAEDLDQNGSVGFSDLSMLLATWGPCL